VSISYQYFSFGYLGPSDIVTTNIGRTLHYASTDRDMKIYDYEAFSERIGREAGAHPDTLSPSEKEKYAKRILLDELESKPRVILLHLTTTFLKYIFIPVESLTERFVNLYTDRQTYATHLRPLLVLACLPLWLLSLIPPQDSTDRKRPYYLLVMMFLLYTAALTAINPQQGERIRFPVLAYMFPIILWNVCDLWRRLSLRQKASSIRGIGQSIPEQPVSAKQVSNEART
jgi:hypothetical protein